MLQIIGGTVVLIFTIVSAMERKLTADKKALESKDKELQQFGNDDDFKRA